VKTSTENPDSGGTGSENSNRKPCFDSSGIGPTGSENNNKKPWTCNAVGNSQHVL